MPQLDVATYAPQLVWLIISFVLLYVLMARLALPRIADVLEDRKRRREDNLSKAEELEKEAEALSETYETQLSETRAQAHAQVGTAVEAAKSRHDAAIAELETGLRGKVAEAEAAIAAARTTAMADAAGIAAAAARLAAEKIGGVAVDATAAQAAADDARKARA
jgi:F-type H+-transporting ATPase subunit b